MSTSPAAQSLNAAVFMEVWKDVRALFLGGTLQADAAIAACDVLARMWMQDEYPVAHVRADITEVTEILDAILEKLNASATQ